MKNPFILFFAIFFLFQFSCKSTGKKVDVCIYGGTSAGVIAAYTAAKSGKKVLLVEPGFHLGGMSSGGLGFTDIGNKYVVQGLALDFYRRLGTHYGNLEQWIFEPHVAENIFNEYIQQGEIEVLYDYRIVSADVKGKKIEEITLEQSSKPQTATSVSIRAKIFMDCTYEGDLMARAGVSYTVGREDNSLYGETYNGVQKLNGHQLPDGIDPYKIKGDSTSGLLYGINPEPPLPNGTGDKKIQAYNYRICLTEVSGNRIPITRPDNYDSTRYELLLRLKEIYEWKKFTDVFIWTRMPNGKTDVNNYGGFSTDVIGENWNYPEANYQERAKILKFHEDYTKGLLYFVGHDERIPAEIREGMLQWGYPKDEYTDNGHWSPQLYVREARRLLGETVMTQHHCQGRETAPDGIAYAAYTMDSHNCDRHVVDGMVKNEGNVEVGGFSPYPIAYHAITPRREECTNLLVPVCISASHIAYGSIRMEPVFMVLGQVAAIAACQSIDNKEIVQNVSVEKINGIFRQNPLADGSLPEILIDNNSENVVLSGDWELINDSWKAYGADYLADCRSVACNAPTTKSVKYTPQIEEEGNYNVYVFFPFLKTGGTSNTHIEVFEGKQIHEISANNAEMIVEGQTSGEWYFIGNFRFSQGNQSFIEISNKGANGIVTADAVLLIPEK
jgi:hypothetical protein